MWNSFLTFFKNLTFFKSKKRLFQEQIKKERSKLHLHRQKSPLSKTQSNTRKKHQQLHIHFTTNNVFIKILYVLILIASVCGIWFLLNGTYFSIQTITIKAPDGIWDINIAYKSLDELRGKNIFLSNKSDIISSVQKYQTNIAHISITKHIPNSLTITLYSYPIVAHADFWNNLSYAITSNGVAIPQRKSLWENDALKLTIINTSINNVSINEYKNVVDIPSLNIILQLHQWFNDNFLDKNILNILYYQVENEVHIVGENESRYIFDIGRDINEQIKKLAVYESKNPNTSSVYIDLRITEILYDCTTDNTSQCRKNIVNIYGE